jgi:hypothetical protein
MRGMLVRAVVKMPQRARSRVSATHWRDLWTRRRDWSRPNDVRLAARRRWMAGLIFGHLSGAEYGAALLLHPFFGKPRCRL